MAQRLPARGLARALTASQTSLPLLAYVRRALQITQTCSRHLVEIISDRMRKRSRIPGPERLRMLLEELGGSFLKFGQILSLQVDALPRSYCDALLTLLDRVPPFPPADVKRVFLEEFGQTPEDLFSEFSYQPMASASIGQVHRAVLADSTKVAVKVQRPDARDTFTRDGTLLRLSIRIVLLLRIRTLYFMRDPIREFNDWVRDELDYRREATYAEILRENAKDTPAEEIPRIYRNLSTERVLTMDFLEGYSVMDYLRIVDAGDETKLAQLAELGFNPSQFVSNVITNFMSDTFKHGAFHADLHPANLLIMKNNVVGYVDFGIVGVLTPDARRKQIDLSLAYASGRTEEIFEAFVGICTLSKDADLAGLRAELERRSGSWYREPAIGGVPHFRQSLTTAMLDLLRLCRNYGLLVDREMIKYVRSLMLTDGLVSRLAPGLDLAPHIRRICEEFLAEEARARMASPSTALTFLADLSAWLSAGPSRLLQILDRLERSRIGMRTRGRSERKLPDRMVLQASLVAASWLTLTAALVAGRSKLTMDAVTASALVSWFAWTIWLIYIVRRLRRYGS
ncbi:MAG TPA: AarF/UbiB family protein [Bryobacteraceae bacterium]|nr:AarF/UbiB family protein [Bryobacteraceae bacterium]